MPSGGDHDTGTTDWPGLIWQLTHPLSAGDPRLGERLHDAHEHMRANDRDLTDRLLEDRAEQLLRQMWEHGWQPHDAIEITARKLSRVHLDLATSAVAFFGARAGNGADPPPDWREQIDDLVADDPQQLEHFSLARLALRAGASRPAMWCAAIEWLHLLQSVHAISEVGSAPSTWLKGATFENVPADHLDPKILTKVRALLAKAESTNFPDEAESLTAKAQELMARHAIDQAVIDEQGRRDSSARAPRPKRFRVWIDDPYAMPKAMLMHAIAEANRSRSIFDDSYGYVTLVGYSVDLEVVSLLYTSLLVQATTAVVAAGSRKDQFGRSSTRSFRQSFWLSYGARIGERLNEAARTSVDEATEAHGESLLPVLASRQEKVEDEFRAAFPMSRTMSKSITNAEGYHAGRLAADQADLATRRTVGDESRSA
ncbi:MAG: DUF2786 domain-containing protein [Actinobacteria bacterium]|nr:DUF2786 domain-containing protein [Actinomycetota bacterium]